MIGGVFGSRASTILRALASSLACPAAFLKSNINSARLECVRLAPAGGRLGRPKAA